MKLGILADVHANVAALEAVLAALAAERCDALFFLGDLVGYGPDPDFCVKRLRELRPVAVQGNHDQWAADREAAMRAGEAVQENVRWTRRQLSESSLGYLYNLPQYCQWRGVGLVHATNAPTRAWPFVRGLRRLESNFAHQRMDLCFHGHSHVQLVGLQSKRDGYCHFEPVPEDGVMTIPRGMRAFVNPGSVGQPRDGDCRAAYAVCNLRKRRIAFRRCEYDVEATIDRIREVGLPDSMAERLRVGR